MNRMLFIRPNHKTAKISRRSNMLINHFIRMAWVFKLMILLLSISQGQSQGDPFAAGVRNTEPLSPEKEKDAFILPPGFEIELVASEPDIAKPMNMAFDVQGRLWVTDTLEYPFPVPLDQEGRDSIKVFTDTDKDGRFDKITTFAEGLNIPIGLYPYKNGVLAWSIPNIWWFEDTDGDGVADKREKRYGPLGWERDTHGMNSSFTRGFDGWLYATHGFNNNTTIRGSDGSEVVMNSGNTYRIHLDGSRVEQHTYGQVNPFGMCLDPLGNFYTADCHSAPVYQLLRGAYYPSFGKPHDGLGFGPALMTHAHGSTAICGIVFYDDDQWPMEFRENVFIGNVMTSRLNRDVLIAKGSSRQAIEKPDLLKTTDPWFRPVNLQLGPDGSLYIADFYNRIIGHYEVPLKHPGRDRERGRIWKLTYKGAPGRMASGHGLPDFTQMSGGEIIAQLGHPNITRRMLATHYLSDEASPKLGKRIRKLWNNGELSNWKQRVHSLWVMHRLGILNHPLLGDAVHDEAMEVRTHAMHLMAEKKNWNQEQRNWVILALQDEHPNVQRAAANALSLHPHESQIVPLLKIRETPSLNDPQWMHGMRLALRNQLRQGNQVWDELMESRLSEAHSAFIADVAVAIPEEGAGDYLIWFVSNFETQKPFLSKAFRHAARYASKDGLIQMARLVPDKFQDQLALQLELFESVQQGLLARGGNMSPAIKGWGNQLVSKIIQQQHSQENTWTYHPVPNLKKSPNPWFLQQRSSADGNKDSIFLCSLPPGGESYTGILRSPSFVCPEKLSFYLAGHDGYPDKERQKKNAVRLVDVVSKELLRITFAPRNDTAQPVEWDLTEFKGRKVHLEVVDSDEGPAYAWLALGRLTPSVAPMPKVSPNESGQLIQSATKLIGDLKLDPFKAELKKWIQGPVPEISISVAATKGLALLEENNLAVHLGELLQNESVSSATRTLLRKAIITTDLEKQTKWLSEIVRSLSLKNQQAVVQWLSSRKNSVQWLIEQLRTGNISPLTLRDKNSFDKITSLASQADIKALRELQSQIPQPDHSIQDLIDARIKAFDLAKADLANGRLLFTQACALCHQLNNQGALVGPQLDGIGGRGVDRVMEDILAPDRNIDIAFQTHLMTLDNEQVISGLIRREEGDSMVLATSSGQEIQIKSAEIRSQKVSLQSLMPNNFGELFNEKQMTDLVGFLLKSGNAEN